MDQNHTEDDHQSRERKNHIRGYSQIAKLDDGVGEPIPKRGAPIDETFSDFKQSVNDFHNQPFLIIFKTNKSKVRMTGTINKTPMVIPGATI